MQKWHGRDSEGVPYHLHLHQAHLRYFCTAIAFEALRTSLVIKYRLDVSYINARLSIDIHMVIIE